MQSAKKAVMENFEEPISLYRKQKWNEAEQIFLELAENHPLDSLPNIYAERCQEMRQNSPRADWDGVRMFNQK